MTWTKKSDDFADDCWSLSNAAYRLHDEGLIWSNKKLLDCRIPKDDVRRFKCPEAIGELLETGWWAEEGDVYLIRHHAGYQRLREDVLAQQAANLTNGRKGGRPRKHPRPDSVSESPTHPQTQPVIKTQSVSESPSESPAQSGTERDRDLFGSFGTEGSSRVGGSGGKTSRKKPQTTIPDDWQPTSSHETYARANGVDLEHEARQFRAKAEASDWRYANWNSGFTTWLGNVVSWRAQRKEKFRAVPGDYIRDSSGRRTEVG